MRLKTYEYSHFVGTSREWFLSGLVLGPINLVVGKNASGKTRTLNTISGLGKLVSGRQKPAELATGNYTAVFDHEGRTLRYHLAVADHKVTSEEFSVDGSFLLQRGTGGTGVIYHEKQDTNQEFQTPEGDAAVVARRDSVQHKFLEPLSAWGDGVRYYAFGDKMGHASLTFIVPDAPAPDPNDVNAVTALFRKGKRDFPDRFATAVRDDMNAIGYDVEKVDVMPPTDVSVMVPFGTKIEPLILFAQERDLPCVTQQNEMSQGMFRALSVLILLNYAAIASRPSCIIIDDIGEGLDFERSCKLIDVIRKKAAASDVQLVVSTNDKFVMNEVPLEEWSVLRRQGNHVSVLNHDNSRAIFEEFRFTGLSNFSFFEMDFVNSPPEEVVAHEEAGGVR
jgi:energy-coupling factor transporter ATP-binding protein EcfA2